jgi:hypothetical protein
MDFAVAPAYRSTMPSFGGGADALGKILKLPVYFGASEATIFSKHGSPRSGSQNGSSFNRP